MKSLIQSSATVSLSILLCACFDEENASSAPEIDVVISTDNYQTVLLWGNFARELKAKAGFGLELGVAYGNGSINAENIFGAGADLLNPLENPPAPYDAMYPCITAGFNAIDVTESGYTNVWIDCENDEVDEFITNGSISSEIPSTRLLSSDVQDFVAFSETFNDYRGDEKGSEVFFQFLGGYEYHQETQQRSDDDPAFEFGKIETALWFGDHVGFKSGLTDETLTVDYQIFDFSLEDRRFIDQEQNNERIEYNFSYVLYDIDIPGTIRVSSTAPITFSGQDLVLTAGEVVMEGLNSTMTIRYLDEINATLELDTNNDGVPELTETISAVNGFPSFNFLWYGGTTAAPAE